MKLCERWFKIKTWECDSILAFLFDILMDLGCLKNVCKKWGGVKMYFVSHCFVTFHINAHMLFEPRSGYLRRVIQGSGQTQQIKCDTQYNN